MILQNIISQSSNEVVFDEQPNIEWGGALTGDYPILSGITKTTIFKPTVENINTYNHHIQSKQYYGNDIHVIFSTHEADEKGFGSRIRYSKSINNGLTWSAPIELLEAQDDSTKDFRLTRGRQSIACGFGVYNSELYAIVSLDEFGPTTGTEAIREGIGMIAIKINNNSTFGTPFYIDTPQADFIAPLGILGYPNYSFNETLRSGLRTYFLNNQKTNDLISYFCTPNSDALYARVEYLGVDAAEPTTTILPNGQYLKLWKADDFKIAQTSNNGINWSPPYKIGIPDVKSRARVLTLKNDTVVLTGNNQGARRDPLYFALSNDGFNYSSDNIYQIDKTTYPPQFSGEGKGQGAQHPSILELNNGKIMVTYNWNKEEVYSSVFNAPTII